jgi:hypothetical protein
MGMRIKVMLPKTCSWLMRNLQVYVLMSDSALQEDSLLHKFVTDSEYESVGALRHPESSVVWLLTHLMGKKLRILT